MIDQVLQTVSKDFFLKNNYIYHKYFGKLILINKSKDLTTAIIKNIIYDYYYCQNRSKKYTSNVSTEFILKLQQLQKNKKYLDKKWIVQEIIDETTFKAFKNGIYLYFNLDKHTCLDSMPQIEEYVDVYFSCHMPNISPGFYLYNSINGSLNSSKLSRVYFHLLNEEAIQFCEDIMNQLNDLKIKFQLKILQDLKNSKRIDNCVLYFDKKDKEEVLKVISKNYDVCYFKMTNSPFHLSLHNGIGYAEEPTLNDGNQESYGTHRSKILATSIYNQLSNKKQKEISTSIIVEEFLKSNINVQEIYKEID